MFWTFFAGVTLRRLVPMDKERAMLAGSLARAVGVPKSRIAHSTAAEMGSKIYTVPE